MDFALGAVGSRIAFNACFLAMISISYLACSSGTQGASSGSSASSTSGGRATGARCNSSCCGPDTPSGLCCNCFTACAPGAVIAYLGAGNEQALGDFDDCICAPNVCGVPC